MKQLSVPAPPPLRGRPVWYPETFPCLSRGVCRGLVSPVFYDWNHVTD